MSVENLKEFLAKTEKDLTFIEKVKSISKKGETAQIQQLIEWGAEAGLSFTIKDYYSLFKELKNKKQLSHEDLDKISGGNQASTTQGVSMLYGLDTASTGVVRRP